MALTTLPPPAESEKKKDGAEKKQYTVAVNGKAHGRVHLLSRYSASLPPRKRRAVCGWWIGKSVSVAILCNSTEGGGALCRNCFRTTEPRREANDDTIEQFA